MGFEKVNIWGMYSVSIARNELLYCKTDTLVKFNK